MAKKTAIIILNYNTSEDSLNCVDSVEQFNSASIKYIIVDNGSSRINAVSVLREGLQLRFSSVLEITDSEVDQVETLPYVTFLRSEVNNGYAAGNNKGLRLAYADDEIDSVLILNSDILFIDDIIPKLIGYVNSLPDVGVVSPILLRADRTHIDYNCARLEASPETIIRNNFKMPFVWMSKRLSNRHDKKRLILYDGLENNWNKDILPIELPSGSCMLMDKKVIQNLGGFDEHTFLYYEEDILHKKMQNIGLKAYLALACKAVHLGASSTSKEPGLFIVKTMLKSQRYYVYNYSETTWIKKQAYLASYGYLYLYSLLKDLIKKLLKP